MGDWYTARSPAAIDRANDRVARRRAVADRCTRITRRLGRVAATAFVAMTGVAITLTAAEHYLEQHPQAAQPYVIDLCAAHLGGCEPVPESPDPTGVTEADPAEPEPSGVVAPAPVVAPPPAPDPRDADESVEDSREPPADGGGGFGLMGVPLGDSPESGQPGQPTEGCDDPDASNADPEPRDGEARDDCASVPEPAAVGGVADEPTGGE